MSTPENKPILFFPELPKPYGGVFKEVLADYTSNPESFKEAVRNRILIESPDLGPFIENVETSNIPKPEYSYKWAFVYYETFSRSARKDSLPMLQISKETLVAIAKQVVSLSPFDEAKVGYSKAQEADLVKRINRDENSSGELKQFWTMVDEDVRELKRTGVSDDDISVTMTMVRLLQRFLHKQESQYRDYEEQR